MPLVLLKVTVTAVIADMFTAKVLVTEPGHPVDTLRGKSKFCFVGLTVTAVWEKRLSVPIKQTHRIKIDRALFIFCAKQKMCHNLTS